MKVNFPQEDLENKLTRKRVNDKINGEMAYKPYKIYS